MDELLIETPEEESLHLASENLEDKESATVGVAGTSRGSTRNRGVGRSIYRSQSRARRRSPAQRTRNKKTTRQSGGSRRSRGGGSRRSQSGGSKKLTPKDVAGGLMKTEGKPDEEKPRGRPSAYHAGKGKGKGKGKSKGRGGKSRGKGQAKSRGSGGKSKGGKGKGNASHLKGKGMEMTKDQADAFKKWIKDKTFPNPNPRGKKRDVKFSTLSATKQGREMQKKVISDFWEWYNKKSSNYVKKREKKRNRMISKHEVKIKNTIDKLKTKGKDKGHIERKVNKLNHNFAKKVKKYDLNTRTKARSKSTAKSKGPNILHRMRDKVKSWIRSKLASDADFALYKETIKTAYENPDLRPQLLPMLRDEALRLDRQAKTMVRTASEGKDLQPNIPKIASKVASHHELDDPVWGYFFL